MDIDIENELAKSFVSASVGAESPASNIAIRETSMPVSLATSNNVFPDVIRYDTIAVAMLIICFSLIDILWNTAIVNHCHAIHYVKSFLENSDM